MPAIRDLLAGLLAAALASTAFAVPLTVTAVDAKGAPLPSAAISVHVKGAARGAAGSTTADMTQRGRRFIPQVLVVQTGTAVSFPNLDTVRHHVYSFSLAKTFEIKLYAGTPAAPIVFDKAGTAVLGCNIHDKMLGYIHVVDTPYFAVTDESGTAQLDVPAGEHQLQLWHAGMPAGQAPAAQPLSVRGPHAAIKLTAP